MVFLSTKLRSMKPAVFCISGNSKMEPGASVCRIAPCFVRFGSFQLPSSRGESQAYLAKNLADWLIKYHFPHLQGTLPDDT